MKFNSQVCTSKVQSERLLALGLKRETADMVLLKEMVYDEENHCTRDGEGYLIRPIEYLEGEDHRGHIPAWSLDRLMELVPHRFGEYCDYANYFMYYYIIPFDVMEQFRGETRYEYLIDCIEWLIKQGYFNKEYLEE